ncbi:hypothetical protein SAMN00790413_00176 [Deinococcus hopiensis KR-140]|uniref:DUF1349 domain-containing protein n=2 Tax=Deinococcus TaxID=1298 RepID=A0A1W1V5U4_9DEIO|nr:hypothetical protein SAMN00790413_00176 [Deinococcus hopiensis KR-140]
MTWHAPPPFAREHPDGALEVRTGNRTDFWRETQYGFTRDDGHALLRGAPLEFTASVRVRGEYRHLYDQAGLMLRASGAHWVKTGVEYVGRQQWSTVATLERSDWSVAPAADYPEMTFRMVRRGDALIVHARPEDGMPWALLRVAYFPPDLPAQVGVMACSPQREGFRVTFREFTLSGVDCRSLHELVQP